MTINEFVIGFTGFSIGFLAGGCFVGIGILCIIRHPHTRKDDNPPERPTAEIHHLFPDPGC